jgi:N-acetylmuramoyl-L-alanine amidase
MTARTSSLVAVFVAAVALVGTPSVVEGQGATGLRLVGPAGARATVPLAYHRGYAAVPLHAMEFLGWTVGSVAEQGEARRGTVRIQLRTLHPLFRWGEALLQLANEPYRIGDEFWVPLQLLSDFLPQRMEEDYTFHSDVPSLEVFAAGVWGTPSAAAGTGGPPLSPRASITPEPSLVRVVVIDPGHGGVDSGARGPNGMREKDIALKIGLLLARELEQRPDLEVHLTRSKDLFLPLWERGEQATEIKGDRPGIFISLHANSGVARDARGFETYFLSDARTEHEFRVAALENAALQIRSPVATIQDPGLSGILKELRNFDHQHWSSLLAEVVQEGLAPVHPGPNRGVKQAPLAVITNAMMPAVLVEVGFISNRAEERLLGTADFQAAVARALSLAVDRFFGRYPPGASASGVVGR